MTMAFIDMEKAVNKVDNDAVHCRLIKYNINPILRGTIMGQYSSKKALREKKKKKTQGRHRWHAWHSTIIRDQQKKCLYPTCISKRTFADEALFTEKTEDLRRRLDIGKILYPREV